jgi:hypothetical protein
MNHEDAYAAGREHISELVDWWDEHGSSTRNEAATRLHLLDEIIFRALKWPKSQVFPEEHQDGEYADYSLGKPATRVIVEAKRAGAYFELPAGVKDGVINLKTAASSNPALEKAIDQAIRYCQSRGVPIAVVCNGHQLAAFFASRQDGVPPKEGKALVFTSLASMRDLYDLLWNNLSRPAVESLALHKTLDDSRVATPPEKLSARISDYPGRRVRNKIQTELKILGDAVLQDIVKAPEIELEFLKRCYTTSETLSKYALVSREILEARYSEIDAQGAEVAPIPARDGGAVSGELSLDVVAGSLSRRPLILLGDVGVGKSIFINHFMRIDAKEVMEKSVALNVDFGGEPALATDLNEYVADRFATQLAENYDIDINSDKFVRQVYKHSIQSFEKSVAGRYRKSNPEKFEEKQIEFLEAKVEKRDQHLKACLEFITKSQRRQVVVFLDNIDQRNFEFQERVFLIGQSLAETWPATVFLSLRPETFNRSRHEGSLTAYQPRVFTIAPPVIGRVVRKRLSFCREIVADPGRKQKVLPAGLDAQASTLALYLEILESSFGESRRELVEFLENLSGGNAREALGFLNTFVGSGNVDTHKILRIHEEDGSYFVPLHEFLRAMLYGDSLHYDPESSPIANLFEISSPDRNEHFLTPLLLAHVERTGETGHQDGFVGEDSIAGFAQGLGFLPRQVEFALERCVRFRLLERSDRFEATSLRRYRITTVGAYTYKRLCGIFAYTDAMTVDTPIGDEAVAEKMHDVQGIRERVERSRIFCDYLDRCWAPFLNQELPFDWPDVRKGIEADYSRIERTLRKRPHLALGS